MQTGLLGLPKQSWGVVKGITPGMPLFLHNLTGQCFHDVFEAVSARTVSFD